MNATKPRNRLKMNLESRITTKNKLKTRLRVSNKLLASVGSIVFLILATILILSQLGNSEKTHGAVPSSQIDLRSNAYEITELNQWSLGDAAFTTQGASGDQSAGSCASGPNYNVWFTFRAIHDTVTIDLKIGGSEGSMTRPFLVLWDSAGSELACAAYSSPTSDLTIQYNSLNVGDLYYISVDHNNSTSDTGTFRLDVNNVSDVVYYAIDDDDWDKNSTWSTSDGGSAASSYPTGANVVYIKGYKVDVDNTQEAAAIFMVVESDHTELKIDDGHLTVKGNFEVTNSGVNKDMKIEVKDGGSFNIWGDATFTRDGGNKDFELKVKDNASMTVNGDFTMDANSGSSDNNDIKIRDDARVNILGDLTLDYSGGRKIKLDLEDDTKISVGGNIYMYSTTDSKVEIDLANRAVLSIGGNFVRGSTPYGELDMNNDSKLVFSGSTGQQTFPDPSGAGNDDFTFQDVEFNNTYGTIPQIVLDASVTLSDSIIFTNGVLATTSTELLIIEDNSDVTGASANSYVDGPLKKIGNETFEFPVGDGSYYAPIEISAPSSSSAEFTAQYFYETYADVNSIGSGIDRVSSIEYWDLQRNNGSSPGNDVFVTLHWTTSGHGFTDLDSIHVAQYTGGQWDALDPATATGTVNAGTVSSGTKASSFGTFTFGAGGPGNPLPISLLYFQATLEDDNNVKLNWATSLEINNDYFTLYKSLDGEQFAEMATVKGAGNSQQEITYSYVDENAEAGTNYYMLKQTDFDGKYEYFNMVAVEVGMKVDGLQLDNVWPNPITNQINIRYLAPAEGYLQMELINLNGQLVKNHAVEARPGVNTYVIDQLDDLPSGIYFLTLRQGESQTQAIKLIKSQ